MDIVFRPNKPASPHLNGKVERSQITDKTEFYPTIALKSEEIDMLLAEWQHYYNWERPHSTHNGKTPMEKYIDLCNAPFSDEVSLDNDPDSEHIQLANYKNELALKKL
ncbi:transposase [Aliikangiella coralliicola]|uniref:Transposase n=1 Tax=Aliikangiella coralliicola TaxID=2592383 RepID=A0A545UGU9_9GAMM|nr:transposase [Aliikangiella coralliicola]